MTKGKYQIPFDGEGNQQHYPQHYYPRGEKDEFLRDELGRAVSKEPEWRDNAPFETTLKFEHYERGRSAAYFIFKRSEGGEVTVFLTDFTDMVPFMNGGFISGTFEFTKRGMNYGCKLVKAA